MSAVRDSTRRRCSAVPLVVDVQPAGAQRLFDRVDPQVHAATRARYLTRDCRLADARQTAKRDQHRGQCTLAD
jgi:hypothetical protein